MSLLDPIDPEDTGADADGLPQYSREEFYDVIHRFGESPQFIRRIQERREGFSVTIRDGVVLDLAGRLGIDFGDPHPTYRGAYCTDIATSTGSEEENGVRFHVEELTATYTVPQIEGRPIETEGAQFDPHPLSRPDTWSFQTQGASIAALSYYDDSNTQRPLTNSAFSPLLGLSVDEAQTKVVIRGNRATFPSALATALTNCVNQSPWLGGAADCWKVQGINGELKYEVVNGSLVRYWEVVVEVLYRQTGWNLLIPDVGFNYISGGQLRRAVVWDSENNEWLASADPVALNGSGGLAGPGQAPAILTRRVYRRVNFSSYFGDPPN